MKNYKFSYKILSLLLLFQKLKRRTKAKKYFHQTNKILSTLLKDKIDLNTNKGVFFVSKNNLKRSFLQLKIYNFSQALSL